MMRLMGRSISLRHLACGNAAGQVSTLLILMTVVLLSFVLVTANMAQMAAQATATANAADMAALSLGSQLASKAHSFQAGLTDTGCYASAYTSDERKACRKTDYYEDRYDGPARCINSGTLSKWLAWILAALAVIVATILSWGTLTVFAVGIGAGIVGGVSGALIAGTSVWQGVVNGITAGITCASIAVGVGQILEGAGALNTASGMANADALFPTTSAGQAGLSSPWKIASINMKSFGKNLVMKGVWKVGAGAVTAGSEFWTDHMFKEYRDKAMSEISDMFKKLDEKTRIRESTIFTAMGLLVDDPNMVYDNMDYDDDGDVTEQVSPFHVWEAQRLKNLVSDEVRWGEYIRLWLREHAIPFMNIAYSTYAGNEYLTNGVTGTPTGPHEPGVLESEDARFYFQTPGEEIVVANEDNDGPVVEPLREFEARATPINVPFWETGPSAENINAYMEYIEFMPDNTIDTDGDGWPDEPDGHYEGPPPVELVGYDELDGLVDDLRGMVLFIYGLSVRTRLASSWRVWTPTLYNPNDDRSDPASIYFKLEEGVRMIRRWIADLDVIAGSLPACQTDAGTGLLSNAPCSFGARSGSTDADPDDELQDLYARLEALIPVMDDFRQSIPGLIGSLSETSNQDERLADLGGKNPATYTWTDSRGQQSVRVQVGNFAMPIVHEIDHGPRITRKTCWQLFAYTDAYPGCKTPPEEDNPGANLTAGCDGAWVRVTRQNQSNVPMGFLGRWNPFRSGTTKAASAHYTYDYVGLKQGDPAYN